MNYSAVTNFEEMTICVEIITTSPQVIRLRVSDYDNPLTYFTDRFKTINGKETLYVMMPLTPKKILIEVFNEKNGNLKKGQDNSFIVSKFYRQPLKKRLDVVDIYSKKVRSFIRFAEQISYHLSYLTPGTRISDCGQYKIEILPEITNANGKELNTPARISKSTGLIQISKKAFNTYTVPMRLAILLHEYSHYYINENIDDESEADLNGLLIYLGLGYPRIEAHEAWIDVFMGAQNEENAERYAIIQKFIQDFENQKI